ncbi:MAG: helix-turn-helix domain-containing protein [Candidatus Nanoarchaeia archaeon]
MNKSQAECEPLIIDNIKYYSIKHIEILRNAGYTWDQIANAYNVSKNSVYKWYKKYKNIPSELLDKDFDFKMPTRQQSRINKIKTSKSDIEEAYHQIRFFIIRQDYVDKETKIALRTIKKFINEIYNCDLHDI